MAHSVRVEHRLEPVRNGQQRAAREARANGFLDEGVGLGVDGRSGLVLEGTGRRDSKIKLRDAQVPGNSKVRFIYIIARLHPGRELNEGRLCAPAQ